jgi:hypothetical protein
VVSASGLPPGGQFDCVAVNTLKEVQYRYNTDLERSALSA